MTCDVQQSWAAFEILKSQEEDLVIEPLAHYQCAHCGGRKSYDVWDDLPVCIDCGIQDSSFVSDEPEWRSGIDESGVGGDPSRVGAPVNVDHFSASWGQSTRIKAVGKSYKFAHMARIHDHTTMNHRDRALFHAYEGMDRIGKFVLKLPDAVMYQAKIKYRAFNSAVLTRGAVRNGIKANCIFQACREFGVNRTTQEIAEAFGIPSRDLSRTFQMYQEQVPETDVHVTSPADLVPRFFNGITWIPESARGRLKMKAVAGCKVVDKCVDLMGRTPKAVACAVIYIVLTREGHKTAKAELCRVCDVSVPTLGKIETIVKESGLL